MLKTLPDLVADAKSNCQTVTAQQALKHCQINNALLIDVREPSEFEQNSIDKAINIPRGVLEMQMLKRFPDESMAIYIHCAAGGRAILAAEQLTRIGYQNVYAITCNFETIINVQTSLNT